MPMQQQRQQQQQCLLKSGRYNLHYQRTIPATVVTAALLFDPSTCVCGLLLLHRTTTHPRRRGRSIVAGIDNGGCRGLIDGNNTRNATRSRNNDVRSSHPPPPRYRPSSPPHDRTTMLRHNRRRISISYPNDCFPSDNSKCRPPPPPPTTTTTKQHQQPQHQHPPSVRGPDHRYPRRGIP